MATERLCSIPDCGKQLFQNGMCSMHNARNKRNGSPYVVYKSRYHKAVATGTAPTKRKARTTSVKLNKLRRTTTQNTSADIMRQALNLRTDECFIWPLSLDTKGYPQAFADGKVVRAHRYVCQAAHGVASSDKHAAHYCGNKACINPAHLRWATRSENERDKIKHGRTTRGERYGLSKLTEENVREIRRLRGVMYQKDIAKIYNVSPITICDVQRGRSWGWLD